MHSPPLPAIQEDYALLLRQFAGLDEVKARDAFDRLSHRFRNPLERYMRRYVGSVEDREDLIQTVLRRIWLSRTTFEPLGPGAWWRYMQRTADRCAIDEARRRSTTVVIDVGEPDDIPDRDLPYIDAAVVAIDGIRSIYEAADRLWLGRNSTDKDFDRKLLAAQLFYIDRVDLQEISELLGRGATNLGTALRDETILLALAYSELYWSNDALAGQVLNPQNPLSSAQLNELAALPTALKISAWTPVEIKILLWRLRSGLLAEQILRFEACSLNADELQELFDRFRERYPFESAGRRLLTSFGAHGVGWCLIESGLWKRMVFQFHCSQELPMKQIIERLEPPATVVGFKLTAAMLTGWIGMGRLFTQLVKYLEKEAGVGC